MSDIVFDGMMFDRLRKIGDQSDRIAALEAEIARLRLTDAEREALHHVVGDVADITGPVEDTLRGLLERMK